MNKKAILMETFNVLIAAAVIASVFFIFYTWYGISERGTTDKINAKTAEFKQSYALINLLNTPVGNETIADMIVANDPYLASNVKKVMEDSYGPLVKYELLMDNNIIARGTNTPIFPLKQEVVIPLPYTDKTAVIALELEK